MVKMALRMVGFAAAVDAITDLRDQAGDAKRWKVGPTVHYGVYQEYGTSRHPPQPYMRPAARTARSNLSKHVSRSSSLEEAVKSVAMEVEAEGKKNAPVDTGALRNSITARPAGGR